MIARLSGGRYAAADVLCQMSLLFAAAVEHRASGRARRTTSGRRRWRRAKAAKLETDRPQDAEQRLDAPPQGYVVVSRGGKVLTQNHARDNGR